MTSRWLIRTVTFLALAGIPAFAQADFKTTALKHLKISRDFTLKVADQMPEADFGFKLTAPQMSFAEQLVHLSAEQAGMLAPIFNEKPKASKPASMSKKDVIAFVQQSYDASIDKISKLTPEQLSKGVKSDEGPLTGMELVMLMMDHNTHHRASAEMYLRAKGIAPTDYQF